MHSPTNAFDRINAFTVFELTPSSFAVSSTENVLGSSFAKKTISDPKQKWGTGVHNCREE